MTPMRLVSLVFSAILLPVTLLAAEPIASSAVVGKYGFGYGDKLASSCAPISEKLAQKFDKCEWEKEELSYSLKTNFYTCDISKNGDQYRIFQSKARCREDLAYMKANAP